MTSDIFAVVHIGSLLVCFFVFSCPPRACLERDPGVIIESVESLAYCYPPVQITRECLHVAVSCLGRS